MSFFLSHHINLLSPSVTGLIFYDTKVTVMNRVLNATVQRTADHAAPEITLDPLEIVGGMFLFGRSCISMHHSGGRTFFPSAVSSSGELT